MVEIRGRWLLVDALVNGFMAVFFVVALLDYWPPRPYDLSLLAGLAVATAWWLGIVALWMRYTVRARRRTRVDASGPSS